MNRKQSRNTGARSLPDQDRIESLLKEYGDALFEPCPDSEQLVMYCEDPASLSDHECRAIESHLIVCLDCRDKVQWLSESEEVCVEIPSGAVTSFTLPVCMQPVDHVQDQALLAYAAQSHPLDGEGIPSVPYITSEDGSIHGEIGQDLDYGLFLYLDRLPGRYRWHAVQVRAITRDQRVIESPCITLTDPKIMIAQHADIRPEDLDHIELRLIHLRPS